MTLPFGPESSARPKSTFMTVVAMMSSMTSRFPLDSAFSADSTSRSTAQQFDQMMAGFRVVMYVVTIGFVALFGWIIAKLLSRPICEEFGVT
jgi:hypothetical protein